MATPTIPRNTPTTPYKFEISDLMKDRLQANIDTDNLFWNEYYCEPLEPDFKPYPRAPPEAVKLSMSFAMCTPSRDGRYTDDLVDAIEHAWTGIMDSPPKIIEKKENEIITDEPATENLPYMPATCQYPVPQMH
jgi:hypothetical protein